MSKREGILRLSLHTHQSIDYIWGTDNLREQARDERIIMSKRFYWVIATREASERSLIEYLVG